jgi:hypothetical protein
MRRRRTGESVFLMGHQPVPRQTCPELMKSLSIWLDRKCVYSMGQENHLAGRYGAGSGFKVYVGLSKYYSHLDSGTDRYIHTQVTSGAFSASF